MSLHQQTWLIADLSAIHMEYLGLTFEASWSQQPSHASGT